MLVVVVLVGDNAVGGVAIETIDEFGERFTAFTLANSPEKLPPPVVDDDDEDIAADAVDLSTTGEWT